MSYVEQETVAVREKASAAELDIGDIMVHFSYFSDYFGEMKCASDFSGQLQGGCLNLLI